MSQFLKQSTAATIMFGPFVDMTDGVTLEVGAGIITSIDHATTGIFLSKNGAAAAIRHQSVTASVLDAYGMFKVTLDATDTDTVGSLDVLMAEAATFLPVHKTFMVLPANVYDALMDTDKLQVDLTQWLGVAPLALSSQLVQALETTLQSRLSVARAGYLDELAAANLPSDIDAILADTGTTLPATLVTIAGYIDTEIAAIIAAIEALQSIADKLDSAMEADGAVHRFTENALEEAPAGGGAAPTVEEIDAELTEAHGDGSWREGPGGGGYITLEGWPAKDRIKVLKQLNDILTMLKKKLDATAYQKGLTALLEEFNKLLWSVQAGTRLSEKNIKATIGKLVDQMDGLMKVGKTAANKEDIKLLRESLNSLVTQDEGYENLGQKILGVVNKLEELKQSFKTSVEEAVAPLLPDETLERMANDER